MSISWTSGTSENTTATNSRKSTKASAIRMTPGMMSQLMKVKSRLASGTLFSPRRLPSIVIVVSNKLSLIRMKRKKIDVISLWAASSTDPIMPANAIKISFYDAMMVHITMIGTAMRR